MRTITVTILLVLLAIEPHGLNATIIHSLAIVASVVVLYKLFKSKP